MHYIVPKDRHQLQLMPSVEQWVSRESPVRIIDELVDKIVSSNPSEFSYKGQVDSGRRAYSPATHLKLLLYGYLHRIKSSRELERATYVNIEVIWLLGDLHPDFKTIADYRRDNADQIRLLRREVGRFLKGQGLISGKTVAIDGTKVKANAKREMLSQEKIESRLRSIDRELGNYLRRLAENDAEDDDDEPQGLEEKLEWYRRKVEDLEHAKSLLNEEDTKQVSVTDPDSRLMKSRDGKLPCYNVQMAVDGENKFIVGLSLTQQVNDIGQLLPMVEELHEHEGLKPDEILADKGYYETFQIEEVETRYDSECFIPLPGRGRDRCGVEFEYDEVNDRYICSEGGELPLKKRGITQKDGRLADQYQGINCGGCDRRKDCTKSKDGRIVSRYYNQKWRDRYRRKMLQASSLAKTALRKTIVEHPFGTIKQWMGKIPLLLRGLKGAQTEMEIYATGYNLRRLWTLFDVREIIDMIRAYDWRIA